MSSRIPYRRQLDSVRAIAVTMVILHHFLPDFQVGRFSQGAYGVEIFFTISGFLITAILLEQKESITHRWKIVKNFIIKRSLRLFPIYFLVLFFFTILGWYGFHVWQSGEQIYYFTYTSNFLIFMKREGSTLILHFWTLAVEEQFYLVWPWLLLFFPSRKEWILILAVILTGVIFKFYSDLEYVRFLTINHFDTLGMGAMMAWLVKFRSPSEKFKSAFIQVAPVLIVFLILLVILAEPYVTLFSKTNAILFLLISAVFVLGSFIQFKGIVGSILNFSPLVYIGKISYGLYLYHKFIPYFAAQLLLKFNIIIPPVLDLIVYSILVFVVAHLSYQLIEKRILRLKDSFDL